MEELKRIELNNKSLDEFDKLMNYHLDKIEELEINEININNKLYNLISLCTNLKQLIIRGDLRSDVNKIFFNICNPEKIDTLVLEAVKLPTNKVISKFSNLKTISLNNIQFSDLIGFFNKIPNPEKIVALNLTNVDFGKRPISMCSKFYNLKYLNFDNLKNCVFDSFDFISENTELIRFEFKNNEVDFDKIRSFVKCKNNKKINLNLKTTESCDIQNGIEINDNEVILTVNSCDIDEAIDSISFYKLSKLFIILDNDAEISQYIRKFKKIKGEIVLAINDISYFDIEDAIKFRERLHVEFVNILETPKYLDINEKIQCYSIKDYIEIREEFDKIKNEKISKDSDEFNRFNEIYEYLKNNIEYVEEETDLKDLFLNKKSEYNYYALAINSILKELKFNTKVIKGKLKDEDETYLWNQVQINGEWYNFDLAYELKNKANKKILQYVFKSNLLNDNQFYKTHIPDLECKPEVCYAEFQELKKEKNVGFWKMLCQKCINLFKVNKQKALPAPKNDEE